MLYDFFLKNTAEILLEFSHTSAFPLSVCFDKHRLPIVIPKDHHYILLVNFLIVHVGIILIVIMLTELSF